MPETFALRHLATDFFLYVYPGERLYIIRSINILSFLIKFFLHEKNLNIKLNLNHINLSFSSKEDKIQKNHNGQLSNHVNILLKSSCISAKKGNLMTQ